jgi:DnaJ-class molecular chaperone
MRWTIGSSTMERCEHCLGTGWRRNGVDPLLGPVLDCNGICSRCDGKGCIEVSNDALEKSL